MATPSEAHVRPPSVDTSPATASGASGDERADGRAATAKRADAAHSLSLIHISEPTRT